MNRFFFACLLLIAICVFAPASAFIDRNDVTSAAQFKDYVPASYLAKAGVNDGMTVDRALDAYITYALSFSSPTAYAYISQLTKPDAVKIHAGGSTAPASRGDVVAEGWNIEVGEGVRVAIRYPGGVMHTITGPYTYTVPAYQKWGASATFGTAPVGTNSRAYATLPDTSGYAVMTHQIDCRVPISSMTMIVKKGTVYAVHYTRDPMVPDYFALENGEGEKVTLTDHVSIITGPGSSALIERGMDLIDIPEKTIFELIPKYKDKECVWMGTEPGLHKATFFDSVMVTLATFWNSLPKIEVFDFTPTTVAGVRG